MGRHHILAALALVCCAGAGATQMKFTTVARGDQSGIEDPRTAVVRTAGEWTALWKEHAPDRKPPVIDFASFVVLAVFSGTRPSAGHSVNISRIEKRGTDLVVTYREQRPGPNDMAAQVLTFPYHIVSTDMYAGPVRFERAGQ